LELQLHDPQFQFIDTFEKFKVPIFSSLNHPRVEVDYFYHSHMVCELNWSISGFNTIKSYPRHEPGLGAAV